MFFQLSDLVLPVIQVSLHKRDFVQHLLVSFDSLLLLINRRSKIGEEDVHDFALVACSGVTMEPVGWSSLAVDLKLDVIRVRQGQPSK